MSTLLDGLIDGSRTPYEGVAGARLGYAFWLLEAADRAQPRCQIAAEQQLRAGFAAAHSRLAEAEEAALAAL